MSPPPGVSIQTEDVERLVSAVRPRRVSYRWRIRLWGMAFVAPTLLFFVVFKYVPMLWAMGLSFTSYDMMKPPRFVGVENYAGIFADPIFIQALENTLVYIAAFTVLITGAALEIVGNINARKHVAVVALARRLAGILYALRRDGSVFQPRRAVGVPRPCPLSVP